MRAHLLEAVLGALPDSTYAFDHDRRCVYANRRMEQLVGRPAGELVGRGLVELGYPHELAARLDAHMDHVFGTGETVQDEVFLVGPAGTGAWFHFTWGPVAGADGRVELVVGTSRDTTERRALEERLRASEAGQAFLLKLADALRGLDDPARIQADAAALLAAHLGVDRVLFGEYDGDGVVVSFEHRAPDVPALLGRHPGTAFGTAIRPLFEAGRSAVVEDVTRDARFDAAARERYAGMRIAAMVGFGVVDEGRVAVAFGVHSRAPRAWTPGEIELIREAGERTWAAAKRARAEQALRQSERRLAAIFANASVGLSEVDPQGRFLRVNDELCRILGRAPAELLGSTILDVTHPDDIGATVDAMSRAQDAGRTAALDKRYQRPDGSAIRAHSSATPFRTYNGLPGNLLVVTMDLTARHAAEAARDASERLLLRFGEASSDVLWVRDAASLRWEYLSPAYAAIYGEPAEDAFARGDVGHWADHILAEDRAHAIACMERVRAGEQVTFEYRIRRVADGAVRWVRDTDFPLRDAEGRVQRIGGIGQDVTDLKRIEADLALSEERMRSLIQGVPQLVWRADPDGRCTWNSPQWMAFTGQAFKDSLVDGWQRAVHPEDLERTREALDVARTSGRMDLEARLQRHDGVYVWHHVRSAPRLDADGRIVEWLGTCTDVQQLKELQAQQDVLVAELQHRTRNLIGVVRAIAERTTAGATSLEDFRGRFRDRMAALGRVQGLLSQRESGRRVSFDQLLHAELAGLGVLDRVEQIGLHGPAGIGLRSGTVQTLALALHELATNAVKYGALSGPDGRLAVQWRLEGEGEENPSLRVDWCESGVRVPQAALEADTRRGYGRELIERALPYQLRAETCYLLGPDGVRCSIRLPLERPSP